MEGKQLWYKRTHRIRKGIRFMFNIKKGETREAWKYYSHGLTCYMFNSFFCSYVVMYTYVYTNDTVNEYTI